MGNSGGDLYSSSERDSGEEPSASPEQPPALVDPRWTTANLPPEFAQRMAELLEMVHDAQTRSLTVGEQQAIAALIQSLRGVLGVDDQL